MATVVQAFEALSAAQQTHARGVRIAKRVAAVVGIGTVALVLFGLATSPGDEDEQLVDGDLDDGDDGDDA